VIEGGEYRRGGRVVVITKKNERNKSSAEVGLFLMWGFVLPVISTTI